MPALTTYISSQYFKAADALGSKQAPSKIVAYVEGLDDIFFWRTILNEVERRNPNLSFELMLPAMTVEGRAIIARGKKSAIHSLASNTGTNMIACVDADYDYLMQGCTCYSQQLLETPYVFHTYCYAIENLLCYAPALHDVCVMATLNDSRVFDFVGFVNSFSEIVYPLFLWSVLLHRKLDHETLTISDMDNVVRLRNHRIGQLGPDLQRLARRVTSTINMLERKYPNMDEELQQLADELRTLGVTPQDTYLYIHGHHIIDNIITPLVVLICKYLRKMREQEIASAAKHPTQLQNEMSCYNSSQLDVKSVIRKHTFYLSSPIVERIIGDIESVLNRK